MTQKDNPVLSPPSWSRGFSPLVWGARATEKTLRQPRREETTGMTIRTTTTKNTATARPKSSRRMKEERTRHERARSTRPWRRADGPPE